MLFVLAGGENVSQTFSMAVSAAGLQGRGLHTRSMFLQTPVGIGNLNVQDSTLVDSWIALVLCVVLENAKGGRGKEGWRMLLTYCKHVRS